MELRCSICIPHVRHQAVGCADLNLGTPYRTGCSNPLLPYLHEPGVVGLPVVIGTE